MGIKQTSEMLTRWGRAIRGENTGEAKRDTGFVKSIFGSFGYSAPAVDDVDASRERADTMIFHMDVDKITKIIDDLDGDTKRILYIRFVNSNNREDGLRLYRQHTSPRFTMGDYWRAGKQSIAIFQSVYPTTIQRKPSLLKHALAYTTQ